MRERHDLAYFGWEATLATGWDFDHAVSTASERVRQARQEAFAQAPPPVARAEAPLPARPPDAGAAGEPRLPALPRGAPPPHDRGDVARRA